MTKEEFFETIVPALKVLNEAKKAGIIDSVNLTDLADAYPIVHLKQDVDGLDYTTGCIGPESGTAIVWVVENEVDIIRASHPNDADYQEVLALAKVFV